MKICAVTMVYRDYWALSQWHAHYSRLIGAEHLYIVAHGADAEINRICEGSTVITIPREEMDGFDRVRGAMLNGFKSGLSQIYDWVIRTDADELVCVDPAHHDGLAGLFAKCSEHAVFALGLDVIEQAGDDDLLEGEPVFDKRRGAIFSGHYSKAFAVCDATPLIRHGVGMRRFKVEAYPFQMPQGVYLVHLKYANGAAVAASDAHRTEMATSDAKGMPGKRWRDAARFAAKYRDRMAALEQLPWDEAERRAYDAIAAEPHRMTDAGVVRAQFIEFDFATQLPDWFRS